MSIIKEYRDMMYSIYLSIFYHILYSLNASCGSGDVTEFLPLAGRNLIMSKSCFVYSNTDSIFSGRPVESQKTFTTLIFS
jgi:hypothetical protein